MTSEQKIYETAMTIQCNIDLMKECRHHPRLTYSETSTLIVPGSAITFGMPGQVSLVKVVHSVYHYDWCSFSVGWAGLGVIDALAFFQQEELVVVIPSFSQEVGSCLFWCLAAIIITILMFSHQLFIFFESFFTKN